MATSITHEVIAAGQRLDAFQPGHRAGAIVSFTGCVRDISHGQFVSSLFLEHYSGMTERMLDELEAKAKDQWPLLAVDIVHRVGELACGEVIVFVAVASAHRQAAFEAASYLMDQLKSQVPLWKRETQQANAQGIWLTPS
jgi:molybdopterin synthase catalytic subunit